MGITDILGFKERQNKEYFWSLVIEPGQIQAGIWNIEEGKANIVSVSPGTPWETSEDLLGASDTALSASIQNLTDESIEPTKTVFGVPYSWVSEGQIKKEHLYEIKKICSSLSLTPVGFVVLPEAIANLFKSEEGSPLNAIVLGLGKEVVEVALFRLGILAGTTTVSRSVSLADDAVEGLMRFSQVEPLPSRLLLYDGKEGELEDARQAILSVRWEGKEKIKFLHTPKVEIIHAEQKVVAVALAGASEIANVSQINLAKDEEIRGEKDEGDLDLGFIVGEDILSRPKELEEKKEEIKKEPSAKYRFANFVGKLRIVPTLLLTKMSRLSFRVPKVQGGSKVFMGVFLALVFAGLLTLWFYPKAYIVVFVSPQKLEENLEVVLDTSTQFSDLANAILSAEAAKTEVSAEKTKSTTGTKTVGEKASGTVKIQNGTLSSLLLPAGTILSSANDLKFTTTSSASVSAALSPSNPGATNLGVIAINIGAEHNLAKDESFKVGNYPKAEVDAVSNENFTGGSSRQIAAVSLEDQKKLEEELTDELLQRGKKQLLAQLSADAYFVEDSVVVTPSSRVFSHKIGDEAANLKLSLELVVRGLSFKKKDLLQLTAAKVKEKMPSGFVLREEGIEAKFMSNKEKDAKFFYDAKILASLVPEVKPDETTKKISGRSISTANKYLTSIPGFTRAEVRISPPVFKLFRILPKVSKNIQLEVVAER